MPVSWLIIKDGVVTDTVNTVDSFSPRDYQGDYDTIVEDPECRFQKDDLFTKEQYLQYYPDIKNISEPRSLKLDLDSPKDIEAVKKFILTPSPRILNNNHS